MKDRTKNRLLLATISIYFAITIVLPDLFVNKFYLISKVLTFAFLIHLFLALVARDVTRNRN